MAADIYGFNKADSDALLGLIGKNNGESKQHNEILSRPIRFYGKLSSTLDPGDTDGVFTVWDIVASSATSIVLEDVVLPSVASESADTTSVYIVSFDGYTGRYIIDGKYC